MKNVLLLVFLLSFCALNAQNLVPNGSFETKDPNSSNGCPQGNCCPGSDSFFVGRPQFWTGFSPTDSLDLSGDYFNPCAPNDGQNNYPGSNEAGCMYPLDGQSYCGFLAFATNLGSPKKESEYIMNSNIPLTANQQYYVEFYVFNAQGNNNYFPSTAYSKRIGAFFTQSPNQLPNGQTNGLNNTNVTSPQIPNSFPAQNYYNSNTWQKISGYFTPGQSGNWTMVIGNFDPGMNSMVTNPCDPNGSSIPNPDLGGLKISQCSGQYIA